MSAVTLDVRPMLAEGEEPFTTIIEHAARVPEGGVLEIVAPFEPVPLYREMSLRGFGHATEVKAPDEFVVRFRQTGITPASLVADIYERYPACGAVLSGHGLDLCCGGAHALETVAQAHGVPLEELLGQLQTATTG